MLRRLTDTIVCLMLLIFDLLAWLLVRTFSWFDYSEPGRIASVSLSALIIVAAPALSVLTVAALARCITKTSARLFYAWALFLTAIAGIISHLFGMLTSFQGMEVGLRWMSCYFAIQATVSLILLIVGLTGGIPRTAETARAIREATRQASSSSTKTSPTEIKEKESAASSVEPSSSPAENTSIVADDSALEPASSEENKDHQ